LPLPNLRIRAAHWATALTAFAGVYFIANPSTPAFSVIANVVGSQESPVIWLGIELQPSLTMGLVVSKMQQKSGGQSECIVGATENLILYHHLKRTFVMK